MPICSKSWFVNILFFQVQERRSFPWPLADPCRSSRSRCGFQFFCCGYKENLFCDELNSAKPYQPCRYSDWGLPSSLRPRCRIHKLGIGQSGTSGSQLQRPHRPRRPVSRRQDTDKIESFLEGIFSNFQCMCKIKHCDDFLLRKRFSSNLFSLTPMPGQFIKTKIPRLSK